MNPIKKLAGQTAVYGISSIVARLLNYFLVPLYTTKGIFDLEQFGVITEMYSYVAFLVILLTYGLETTYFRFSNNDKYGEKKVYSTIITLITSSTLVFIILSNIFDVQIAHRLGYPNHTEYITWFAIIVSLDALSSIPMAKLRYQNKAISFAFINLANVFINIGLNLFFLLYCKSNYESGNTNWLIDTFYNPDIGVGYVFISNLIASICKFLLLSPKIIQSKFSIDFKLVRPLLIYSLPLLLVGLSGQINETFDRAVMKHIYVENGYTMLQAKEQLGIYGACYKIGIMMYLFIQAFRYAAEPFYFSKQKDKDAKDVYANIMKYFVMVCLVAFLGIVLYLDVVKYFIRNEAYYVGLEIVPILLLAYVFWGVYYNLSFWYKLTNKTYFGAVISAVGALITIGLNFLLVPIMGYMGAAWATLVCYIIMAIISYFFGQKYYPVKFPLIRIGFYFLVALGIYLLAEYVNVNDWASRPVKYAIHTVFFLSFLAVIYFTEKPKIRAVFNKKRINK